MNLTDLRIMTGKLIRPAPAEIEFKNMRFLITEQPQDATIHNYIKILKEHRVTHLVCATDPTYKTDDLGEAGVSVTEISFTDGSPPSQEIVEKWLGLVKKEFSVSCVEWQSGQRWLDFRLQCQS